MSRGACAIATQASMQWRQAWAHLRQCSICACCSHSSAQALHISAQTSQIELARAKATEAERQRVEAELAIFELRHRKSQLAQTLDLDRARGQREIENAISPEAIQLALAQSLPQLAQAFQQKLGTVNVTAIDGANPFGFVAAAVDGVMSLARSAGLKLPQPPAEDA